MKREVRKARKANFIVFSEIWSANDDFGCCVLKFSEMLGREGLDRKGGLEPDNIDLDPQLRAQRDRHDNQMDAAYFFSIVRPVGDSARSSAGQALRLRFRAQLMRPT